MKLNYLYEAGPFGSYKNIKNKNSIQELGNIGKEAIFEKIKEKIVEVYVNDIKELMDTLVETKTGRDVKYRICNRYIKDESPDAYGVGARIYLRSSTVMIEQLLSMDTSLISSGTKTYYFCPEEFTFWEKEEQKLQEMFPKFTFKIVLDWVYNSTDALWPGRIVNSNVDKLEHRPFPYPERSTIILGSNVTLDMFIKYWNRYISRCDSLEIITLDKPSMDSLDITIPTDFKVNSIVINGGNNLVNINGVSKYLIGNKEVTYSLNGFRDFSLRTSNGGLVIKEQYKRNPVFERATNGVLSLDNLTYLFDKSIHGSLIFSYFTYNIITGKGKLFNGYKSTNWFNKYEFKQAVDNYLNKQSKN